MPGVRLVLTGDDIGDLGLMPMQAGIPGVDIAGAALSGAGAGRGSPCRRCGRLRGRRHAGAGEGCRRSHRHRMAAAAARDRRGGGAGAGRGAGLAGPAGQSCLRGGARQPGPDRKGDGGRAAHGVADAGQPAPGHQLSRHPRRHRRIRRGRRPPDADARQPGQSLPARHPVRDAQAAAGEDARGDARRRRRVRHQAVHLSRIRAGRARSADSSRSRWPGSPIAPSISSAMRRAATTSPRPSWRSTTRGASSRSTST